MSGIQPGDRVHVEFDGDVTGNRNGRDVVTVEYDVAHGQRGATFIPAEFCTVIVPPVAVGDRVTAENIGQLAKRGTVCCLNDGTPRWYDQCWRDSFGNRMPTNEALPRVVGSIVLRIGGGS